MTNDIVTRPVPQPITSLLPNFLNKLVPALQEQDQDEDLASMVQANKGASMNVVDLMAQEKHKDREISKAFKSAMQMLDTASAQTTVRLSTMMKGLVG